MMLLLLAELVVQMLTLLSKTVLYDYAWFHGERLDLYSLCLFLCSHRTIFEGFCVVRD